MATVKSEKRVTTYHGIENLFAPDVFFNLMGWTDRKCHTEKAWFAVSNFHYVTAERLSFLFGTEKFGNITRAITSFGMLSLAKFYGIATEQTEKIIEDSGEKGFELFKKEIEYICSCGEINQSKTKKKLTNITELYGNNKYNKVLQLMLNMDNNNDAKNNKTVLIDNDQFKTICGKELNENMYKLKRSAENCSIATYVSKIVGHLNNKIGYCRKKNDTRSEIYRGAYVTGLYIISKWILDDTLQKYDEYYTASLLSDIKDVVYTNQR